MYVNRIKSVIGIFVIYLLHRFILIYGVMQKYIDSNDMLGLFTDGYREMLPIIFNVYTALYIIVVYITIKYNILKGGLNVSGK